MDKLYSIIVCLLLIFAFYKIAIIKFFQEFKSEILFETERQRSFKKIGSVKPDSTVAAAEVVARPK